ncbi:hypothetical protein CUMW_114490 [Citrus unshiu]|nr:hypothetical protein CUMW_114490 [Citrus unshiu]
MSGFLTCIKLVGVSGSALSLFKRGQGFKPRSCMESSLWPALYPLWTDSVRAEISLSCGTGLKVPPTVGAHSGPPRESDDLEPCSLVFVIRAHIVLVCLVSLRKANLEEKQIYSSTNMGIILLFKLTTKSCLFEQRNLGKSAPEIPTDSK